MPKSDPVPMLVTYLPKKGRDKELLALIKKHGPALKKVGLITKAPVRLWRATDKRTGEVSFVEMFQWTDAEASTLAHQTPEVMAVWEPMGPVLEALKLAVIEPVAPRRAKA